MCTTILADDSMENCTWLVTPKLFKVVHLKTNYVILFSIQSCFEWCLTKSSGLCIHIWVSVRSNGSDLLLNQCQDRQEKSCTIEELIPTHRHICRKDQCENLLGLFNCTKGVCVNV